MLLSANWRALLAETLGSALLAMVVIGSGIAAQQLSPTDVGLELLENALVTGAGLVALISTLGPISGAHFNPVVSVVMALRTKSSMAMAAAEIPFQIVGCILGAIAANVMFALPTVSFSTHHRASGPHLFAEIIATAVLIVVIGSMVEHRQFAAIPAVVGATITAAYFFTSSTSFANPAITVGRMFSNSFAGIAPASAPGFIIAQVIGAAVGLGILAALVPATPMEGTP